MIDLSRFALGHQRLALFGALLIVLVGPLSFQTHPSREDPAITIRTAVVTAAFPGMSPARVEDLITRRIEEQVRTLPAVENIVSTSRTGTSTVRVELHDRVTDLQPVWQDLREAMNDLRAELPEGTRGPAVNDDYGAVAMATLGVTAAGFTRTELNAAGRELRRALYSVPGVSKVDLHGEEHDRLFVTFDAARLAQLGLSTASLVERIRETNVVSAGGRVLADGLSLTVEPSGNFDALEDLGRIAVSVPGLPGQVAYLADLASVERAPADPPEKPVLVNGERGVVLSVQMTEHYDADAFGRALAAEVASLQQALPVGYQLQFMTFQPREITAAVEQVSGNLYQTVGIVLLVVMAFLGWRSGLIVGVMVPLTMLATLLIMRVAGIELERMSLASLIISLGLLVDNGIVVAEEIGRRVAAGEERRAAAIATGRALAVPLLASSLTTIIAFLPLMLAESEAGEYTRSLSLVIAIALLTSWVLAMTLTPLASMHMIRPNATATTEPEGLALRYRRWLDSALHHRALVLGIVAALVAAAVWGMQFVPTTFFPASDRAQLQVYVDLPVGTAASQTLDTVTALSHWLADPDVNPDVDSHVAYVGDGGPRFYLSLAPIEPDPHRGFLIVNSYDAATNDAIADRIRTFALNRLPEARVTVKEMSMGAGEAGLVEYRLVGPDAAVLTQTAATLRERIRAIPGARDVRDDWENRTIKIVADVDQARALRAGVSSESIAAALAASLSGLQITEYRDGDQLVPVVARADASDRTSVDRVRTLNVRPGSDEPVPLLQVARLEGVSEHAMIQRRNLERVITVAARHETDAAAAFHARIAPALDELELPPVYAIEIGGEIEGSASARSALLAHMPLAAGLILLVLVGQFDSFRRSLLVLSVIPVTLVGVTPALLLMPGAQFSFMAILGLLSLSGIIINNAIVLIDRIEIERNSGRELREAILGAAAARLRPILMTTVTTVTGLLPIIWSGDVLFYDLAVVIAGGLIVGTALTLIVIPALYDTCMARR